MRSDEQHVVADAHISPDVIQHFDRQAVDHRHDAELVGHAEKVIGHQDGTSALQDGAFQHPLEEASDLG